MAGLIMSEATILIISIASTVMRANSMGILYTSAKTIFNPMNMRIEANPTCRYLNTLIIPANAK